MCNTAVPHCTYVLEGDERLLEPFGKRKSLAIDTWKRYFQSGRGLQLLATHPSEALTFRAFAVSFASFLLIGAIKRWRHASSAAESKPNRKQKGSLTAAYPNFGAR